MFKKLILKLIKLYQYTLSPDHGLMRYFKPLGVCKFQPTCSEYTYQAIDKYGVFKGFWLGLKRIFKCHPFSRGGWDPVK